MTLYEEYIVSKGRKDLEENLRYRIRLRERAERDKGFRRACMEACREDVLYFFNAWCWLYEPRPRRHNGQRLPPIIPFITWPHQDPAILQVDEFLGERDIGVEKSRGEGWSWIAVLLGLRDWLFKDYAKVGMVSATEKKGDNAEDPDSLFWKIDWELTKLPVWMTGKKGIDWKRNTSDHTLVNLRNSARITSYSATANVARGGRASWFLMDELGTFPRPADKEAMDSTQHVTESRLVISTPKGGEGAFYDIMHSPSNMLKVIVDWKDNPFRNRGLYRYVNHNMELLFEDNPLPEGYQSDSADLMSRLRRRGYKLEGSVRSPWYDKECDRPSAAPQGIAQELDRDYGGSSFRVFGHDYLSTSEATSCPAFVRGTLNYHPEKLTAEFDPSSDGQCHLWMKLTAGGDPPDHKFVLGADVSTGLGGSFTSNSVACVIDLVTMEQVLEFATNTTRESDFADWCIACAKWLNDAYLIWEHNGPGTAFTKRVVDIGYGNVFRRSVIWGRGAKRSKEVGWHTSGKTKPAMFVELNRSVKSGELKIRSRELARESGQYVYLNGKIEHIQAARTTDESAKGATHGDRVIAAAVCLQGVRDRPLQSMQAGGPDREAPRWSLGARVKAFEEAQKKDLVWDNRQNSELAKPI